MRMMRQLRTWIGRTKGAGVKTVRSQEGLAVYADALRAGVQRGLGVEALQRMLLEEHGSV